MEMKILFTEWWLSACNKYITYFMSCTAYRYIMKLKQSQLNEWTQQTPNSGGIYHYQGRRNNNLLNQEQMPCYKKFPYNKPRPKSSASHKKCASSISISAENIDHVTLSYSVIESLKLKVILSENAKVFMRVCLVNWKVFVCSLFKVQNTKH